MSARPVVKSSLMNPEMQDAAIEVSSVLSESLVVKRPKALQYFGQFGCWGAGPGLRGVLCSLCQCDLVAASRRNPFLQ